MRRTVTRRGARPTDITSCADAEQTDAIFVFIVVDDKLVSFGDLKTTTL